MDSLLLVLVKYVWHGLLQCIESLILLPTDKDNTSLNVKSDSQHFIVVTNSGKCFIFCVNIFVFVHALTVLV